MRNVIGANKLIILKGDKVISKLKKTLKNDEKIINSIIQVESIRNTFHQITVMQVERQQRWMTAKETEKQKESINHLTRNVRRENKEATERREKSLSQ